MVTTAINVATVLTNIDGVQDGINRFLEGSAVLVKALDEVAKLHPFVGGEFHFPAHTRSAFNQIIFYIFSCGYGI